MRYVRFFRRPIKHGMTYTDGIKCLYGAIQRCHNKNNPRYSDYGGRGIIVCDRWRNDFKTFFEDMGPRPSKEYTLERVDNNGNYEPQNCKWATWKEQNNNQRRGSKKDLERLQAEVNTLKTRLAKYEHL